MDFPTSDTQAVENVTFSNLSALSGDNYLNARGIGVVDKSRESKSQLPNPFIEGYNAPSEGFARQVDSTVRAQPQGGIQYFDPKLGGFVDTDIPGVTVQGENVDEPIDP